MLANQLITVVGVETYNDLRNVTFEIYADRCGVKMIDATLLVRQFGIPVVPWCHRLMLQQWRRPDRRKNQRCRHRRRVRSRVRQKVTVTYMMSNHLRNTMQPLGTHFRSHTELPSEFHSIYRRLATVLRSHWDRVSHCSRRLEMCRMALQRVLDRNPLTSR